MKKLVVLTGAGISAESGMAVFTERLLPILKVWLVRE
jgi:hypothetical protein